MSGGRADRDQAHVAAVARAFDVDPRDVRPDTPLASIGWTGSATDWLLAADHLGVPLADDPPDAARAATIADVVAMVFAAGEPGERVSDRRGT